ncbi:MAG: hypothetical protein ACP5K9_03050 [Candidatus Micrarchaeia archaeon]
MVDKKAKLSKKLEQFRRTQEINALVTKGAIEEDALEGSASDAKPAEESHAYDIIDKVESSAMIYKHPALHEKKTAKPSAKGAHKKSSSNKKARKGKR